MKAWVRPVGLGLAAAAVVLGYGLLLWKGPWWFDSSHLRQKDLQPADGVVITGFRTTLVALGAGVIAGLGLYYTHRSHKHTERLFEQSEKLFEHTREKDREQAQLTREGQVTDRYVEAIKLLSSENMTVRIGGIFSLERIARDSKDDRPTVIELLTAHIRENTRDDPRSPKDTHVTADVQAALTVLGRRAVDLGDSKLDFYHCGLTDAQLHGDYRGSMFYYSNLTGAGFSGAKIDGADLSFCKAERAAFTRSTAREAHFVNAIYRNCWFLAADLTNSDFYGCDLSGSDFGRRYAEDGNPPLPPAILRNSRFTRAKLTSTNLCGVDLSTVRGLKQDQLAEAITDENTVLPLHWGGGEDEF
ncbi:pentapeptide repeat-containing protein [Streptomyces lavendulae]|uniref:pentapeptide repeat-containing protein n=1 Tax=Streptomyces sp. SUK 48 TaxID=2582831 RepID=UPI0011CD6C26|nr:MULTISPECIES: pentapeptide repeat-containing protein [Streptomyces]TXJ85237.1 pentapeptide repeat-containing protein [Streptomyces lavendulae]